ncbi:hypothetical protein K438DRAFT_1762716 [Mycena galopus ATCC 62051]|nr:hypothetical protein K438DRAFT_1762716 [Mycena galopus ATCC 62051]
MTAVPYTLSTAVPYTLLATSSPQSPITSTQAMTDDQMDLVEILRSGEDSRLRRYRPERTDPLASPAVVLFCGSADQETEADWDEHRPGIVEMLPEITPLPARKRQKRSNGCGARIHGRAMADRRWRGLLEGASVDVVRLADEYFTSDMKRELLLGKERCGCSRTGVGCAVWLVFSLTFYTLISLEIHSGNPLGTLFTPCSRHSPSSPNSNFSSSHYTFLRAAVSPPLPPPTRRVSIPNDEFLTGRVDRETLQRRIREREELHQLRARVRAVQPPTRRVPLREETVQSTGGRAAFDAWADATLQRAAATAQDVVDLAPLMDLRRSASPPELAPPGPQREVSEEERRREWQRGVVTTAGRSFGREWPTITRTIERTTAPPEPLSRRVLDELRQAGHTIERTTAVPELPRLENEMTPLEELRRDVLAARAIERAERALELAPRPLSLGEALRRNSSGNPSVTPSPSGDFNLGATPTAPEMATRPLTIDEIRRHYGENTEEQEVTPTTRRRTFFER